MTSKDRRRLRELAEEYAAIVHSREMDDRRERWRRNNRLIERTVPFQIEDNGTFFRDLTPPLQCEEDMARSFEAQMLRAITNFRLIDDDRIYPRRFQVAWSVGRTPVCPELQYRRRPDATGRELGYETNTPLADLANSFHKLKPVEFRVDRAGTMRRLEIAQEIFGDILEVELSGRQVAFAGTGIAQQAVLLIGMDDFYIAMLDQPENVHRFFGFITDQMVRYVDWLEEQGLITLDRGEFDVGSGSCAYSDELPRRQIGPQDKVLASDCWGFIEAQEAVGISPDMYAEFIFPYQKRLADRFGLINYGCCEPTHALWPTLQGFHNLRKITVSPWCDVERISEAAGRTVVLSRKPHPLKLCGSTFDPQDFETHLRETLAITRDNFIELIFRDTCPLDGNMRERVAQACQILRRVVERER